ncbi:Hypothetical protein A7982_03853 [Minicystis rosea]|nr:Hypothetical protein A7982_03853 [Minicystis rosea]
MLGALAAVQKVFVPFAGSVPEERTASEACERLVLGATLANLRLYVAPQPQKKRYGTTRASAPASAPTKDDRRSTGAVLARRFTAALLLVSSGVVGSAGTAPAASSHL